MARVTGGEKRRDPTIILSELEKLTITENQLQKKGDFDLEVFDAWHQIMSKKRKFRASAWYNSKCRNYDTKYHMLAIIAYNWRNHLVFWPILVTQETMLGRRTDWTCLLFSQKIIQFFPSRQLIRTTVGTPQNYPNYSAFQLCHWDTRERVSQMPKLRKESST